MGAVGVIGYVSPEPGKNLGDPRPYLEAGLDVGLVWEDAAAAALGGWAQGVLDGRRALAQARALGYPEECAIYFAVDFGATAAQIGAVEGYFAGLASQIPRSRLGAYGDYYVLAQLHAVQACSYYWQTLAWSYGAIFAGACLYQDGTSYLGGAADGDQVRSAWGGWSLNAPPAPPAPAPDLEPAEQISRVVVVSPLE